MDKQHVIEEEEEEEEDNIKVDEDEDEKDGSIAQQGPCEHLPYYVVHISRIFTEFEMKTNVSYP